LIFLAWLPFNAQPADGYSPERTGLVVGPFNSLRTLTKNPNNTILISDKAQTLQPRDYPTVLVAIEDGLDGPIVQCLRRHGFHVLEAEDWSRVFDVVKTHSRPIHLLLADPILAAHVPILQEHRSELQVLFVNKPVEADHVLTKVRQLLGSPPPSPVSIR
jgi:hypothetical protein